MTPERGSTGRDATIRWLAEPPRGVARVRVGSDAVTALPLSAPEGEPSHGETTPGELLAAACSAFIATHLAQRLQRENVPAQELVVHGRCRLSNEVATRLVVGYEFQVRGRVPGLDQNGLRTAARAALTSCLSALGIRSDLPVTLDATLITR